MFPGGHGIALLGFINEVRGERDVRKIGHAKELACQVLVLGKMSLIDVQKLLQLPQLLLHNCFNGLQAYHRTKH